MKAFALLSFALLLAPMAEAQFIDCSGGCSDTTYGLGNDPRTVFPGFSTNRDDFAGTILVSGASNRADRTVCGPSQYNRFTGQIVIREQDDCEATSTNICVVEIPSDIEANSGFLNVDASVFNLGPAGVLGVVGSLLQSVENSVGYRQLVGTCSNDGGEDCALDSGCPSETGCVSSCVSDPAITCTGENDPACPTAFDCVTEIDWDPIGRCRDENGDWTGELCTRDGAQECFGGATCWDGMEFLNDEASCVCCDSTSNVLCAAVLGAAEYPALSCPFPSPEPIRRDASDWSFAGGRGKNWEVERLIVPCQQEGHCAMNDQRACGTRSSIWQGADEGKCEFTICTDDDFQLCDSDPDCPSGTGCIPFCRDAENPENPALASECDDVAFGGIAGDVCDFSEAGFRGFAGGQVLPDGRPDPNVCGQTIIEFHGFAGDLCFKGVDIPDGDPQPGCKLINFGISSRPDLNCDGIDDTGQGLCSNDGSPCDVGDAEPCGVGSCEPNMGRCAPDGTDVCTTDADCASDQCIRNGDLCPFISELNPYEDTNRDGRGDECQCGDQGGDGDVTALDIGGAAQCANGQLDPAVCDATLVDTNGDNSTTSIDVSAVAQTVNGVLTTLDLECIRDLDTTVP